MRKWKIVDGQILSIEEKKKQVFLSIFQAINYHYPDIVYKYSILGKEFTSRNVALNKRDLLVPEVDNYGNANDNAKFWNNWRANDRIDVYVDPQKPSRSVIVNLSKKAFAHYVSALILPGVLLLSFWLVVSNLYL